MKMANIEPGVVYAIASGWAYGYGKSVTARVVQQGIDCCPGLVLGIGKYRYSKSQCAGEGGYIDSEDPRTETKVLVLVPKPYAPSLGEDAKDWVSVKPSWDKPNYWPEGYDALSWPWDVELISPTKIFPFEEWAARHAERDEIAFEMKAVNERISVLRAEVSTALVGAGDALAASGGLVLDRVQWWPGQDTPNYIEFRVVNPEKLAELVPEMAEKLREIAHLEERVRACRL